MGFLGACLLLLLIPVMLQHHHAFLIATWNAYITVFLLPGKPYLWMVATATSLFLAVLTRTLNRGSMKFIRAPSVTLPVLAMGLVTLATAQLTGMGIRALGSDVFGGKKYVFVWVAITAYFAVLSKPLDPRKSMLLVGLFLLGPITACVSNLAYMMGPNFYFMFLLFPVEWGISQAASEQMAFVRITGLAPASTALCTFLLLRYGLRGLLDISKPWRLAAFAGGLALGLFSGFRSVVVVVMMLCFFQFFVERLYKTKFLGLALAAGLLGSGVLIGFASEMPLSVQRTLTVLPLDLDLDSAAKRDARNSLTWRFEMWRLLLDDIPKYFWLGKGYAINPTDLYLADESVKRGVHSPYEPAIIAGDYHNGPLSVIIPFGIWGVLAFLWFLWAGFRVIWRNYKHSPPELEKLNQFLLAYFITRAVFFIVFYGAFYIDIGLLIGLVAVSISANNGVRSVQPASVLEPATVEPEYPRGGALAPA